MKIKNIDEIKKLCEEVAAPLSVEVADVVFTQGKNPTLTIYIDKEGGVDLDTCEIFHNAIDAPLDLLDPTFGMPYTLNVSSLGADRPFVKESDFLSHIGKRVEVKLHSSVRGKKFYDGILTSYDKERITVKVKGGNTFSFDFKNIVKVNEYIDFD